MVKVCSVSCVVARNPGPNRIMYLCDADQKLGFYVRSIFFYGPETKTLDVDRLKSSVAEVLGSYDFWAGRLHFNENGRMEISCRNQGAFFTLATCDLSLDQVTADDFDDFFFIEDCKIKTLEDLPLLSIQVTRLLDGGCAMSILFHHALVDATSGINFLLNFASINRGDGLYMIPNGDRTQLKYRDPPRVSFEHKELAKQIPLNGGHSIYTLTEESVISSESKRKTAPKIERKTFLFTFDKLRKLKQAVLDEGILSECSTFEALAALIWRSHARSIPGKSSSDVLHVGFAVDTRNILDPPLGENFCGNSIYLAHAELSLADLSELPLSSIVAQIQEAKKRLTNEYVRSARDFLHLNPNFWYQPCETTINAWPRLMRKSLELDFGGGKPLRVEFPMDPRNFHITFLPLSSDGIFVSVPVNPIAIATFEELITQF
ncbi:BAHD family acyltransferase, clade V [Selaginella moellendorffii]|uniref:BAHD family acyltransferase, clade V n=2 Tax=Selaginella moellendorffii TaxID=88036 RepID=D8T4C2_SELML|nr:BAHD family acyltransferase, clade V [Selaginella moellendorffii]